MICRKLSQKRNWDDEPWLNSSEVKGDAIHCLLPKKNRLSVFKLEDETQIERIVAALALTRDYLSLMDLAVISEESIKPLKIPTKIVSANTSDKEVNQWHIDLVELTVARISEIATLIRKEGEFVRYSKRDVTKLISNSIQAQYIDLNKINSNLKESLRKKNYI